MIAKLIHWWRKWRFRRKYFDKERNAWLPIKFRAVGDVQPNTTIHYDPVARQWTIVAPDGVVTHYSVTGE